MMDVLVNLGFVVISAIIIATIGYGFMRLKKKFIDETDSYRALVKLENIVMIAVEVTNQTYVDALKAEGKFDVAAHIKAFEKTKQNVIDNIDNKTKKILEKYLKNLDAYIDLCIEKDVKVKKRLNG